jgi:hypothetical protein
MCFAGERRSDRTTPTIRIVFYLFGSIAGFHPSLRWLRSSGRRPSFAGTVLGFGRIGAGDPATVLADRRSRLSCALIGEMSRANTLWGAPRIHGELLKLGFEVAQSTVARYMCRHSRPPSQGWRTFLSNHADGIAANRPLCPADDRIPNSVLSCHCAPRTTTLGFVWRDGKPNRGVDLAPGHRGVPVGPRPAISHSGSRHLVWSSLLAADPCNGHSGPSDRTPIALAKCLR